MNLFVPAMVFNPQLMGEIVRASGYDEDGYQVDFTGIVEKVESDALLLRRGLHMRTIHAQAVGPEGITLGIARKFTLLTDNRPLDCQRCGGHPYDMPNCQVCGGTGRQPGYIANDDDEEEID